MLVEETIWRSSQASGLWGESHFQSVSWSVQVAVKISDTANTSHYVHVGEEKMDDFEFWQWYGSRNIGTGKVDSCDNALAWRAWQAATERAAKIAEESCFCKSGWCLCGSYRVAAKIRETGGR